MRSPDNRSSAQMEECWNCGWGIPVGAKHCPNCGATKNKPAQAETEIIPTNKTSPKHKENSEDENLSFWEKNFRLDRLGGKKKKGH